MLEELFNLVKGSANESVINNSDIPNEQNDAVVAEATNTVASGLRNMVAGGGLQSIISLLRGGNQQQSSGGGLLSNPIVSMMIGHFAGKLMNKFNIRGQQANGIASSLIPAVIGNLISRTNDSSDDRFSIEKLLNSITGGQVNQAQDNGINIGDIIGQFTGNNQQNGGGGLLDIVSQFTQGAQQQQERNGGGGLLDLIQGFIPKR